MSNTVYTIENCTLEEIENGAISMTDIITDKLNGFIVSDFLNQKEIDLLLKGFKRLHTNELVHINSSFDSYPMSFDQYDQMLERGLLSNEDYFKVSFDFISNFETKFGVNITNKLQKLFTHIKDSPKIEVPKEATQQNSYVPYTFRELFPGEGSLKAHCENLFFQEFPSFFTKINAFSTLENQLSFFVVLQKPSSGGELTLFDIIWNKEQKRPNDDEIILENKRTYQFENEAELKRDYLSPEIGSLVVFSGGKIWHRVEKVASEPSRVTLGGFISFSHDKNKLFIWS